MRITNKDIETFGHGAQLLLADMKDRNLYTTIGWNREHALYTSGTHMSVYSPIVNTKYQDVSDWVLALWTVAVTYTTRPPNIYLATAWFELFGITGSSAKHVIILNAYVDGLNRYMDTYKTVPDNIDKFIKAYCKNQYTALTEL